LVPMTMGSIKVSNEKKTFYTLFMAWEPGLYEGLVEEVFTVDLLEGRTVRKTDKNKVTVGYNYLVPGRIFKKPMKRGDIILVNDVELEIVGFYDAIGNPQDDSQIYTNIETYLSLFPQHEDQYKFFFARSNPNANPAEVADKMEKKLMKKRDLEEGEEDFSIQTFEQAIKTFGAVLNIINSVLVLIALISVIVAAVNIMNTMYTAVLERTKEIGIMKAVGATRGIIMTIFVIESGTLGLVGSGLGALIGFLIASAGGAIAAGAGYPILKPVFPAWLIIGCLLFGFLLGAISGLMPARQAAKLKPVDSLHYE